MLTGPESPTFPSGNSYLDLVIRDSRIKIINDNNNKLKALPYDSDHNAIFFNIKIHNVNNITSNHNISDGQFNYNKTNWKKFQKHLNENKITIPNNKNL